MWKNIAVTICKVSIHLLSSTFFVGVSPFAVPFALFPLSFVDITIAVNVLPFAMFQVADIFTVIFGTTLLHNKD